jgi:hypothetical protein
VFGLELAGLGDRHQVWPEVAIGEPLADLLDVVSPIDTSIFVTCSFSVELPGIEPET